MTGPTASHERRKPFPAVILTALLVLGFLALFVLPFAHAPTHPVLSVAYTAGCDNRLAELGLLLLSVMTCVAVWRNGWAGSVAAPAIDTGPISRRLLGISAAVTMLFTLLLGALVVHSGVRYGEANYFLDRTRNVLHFHLLIYRDLEFPYGPLLLYPEVAAASLLLRFGVSVTEAYFLTLAVMNVLGLLWMAYLLNRLPIERMWRNFLLLLFAGLQLHPLAGPNYSWFKFAAPFALFAWADGRASMRARWLAFLVAQLLVLLISPELAVGMTAGVFAYVAVLFHQGSKGELRLLLAPVCALLLFFAGFGRLFLNRLGQAAGGALNLIPEPSPHLLLYGIAVIWLVPMVVGLAVRSCRRDAPLLAAFFLLSLGMLPGALGRCDALHVIFYGVGFLVLSAAAMPNFPPLAQKVWASALLGLAIWTQAVNYRLYAPQLFLLFHTAPPQTISLEALGEASEYATHVATPVLSGLPLATELQLRRSGLFLPEFYPGLAEVWDENSERRKIRDMQVQTWILLPSTIDLYSEPLPNTPLKLAMRFGYRYRERRSPYLLGALLREEISTHWIPVKRFDHLTLYRRKG